MEAFFAVLCLFTPVVAVVGIVVGYFVWSSRGFSPEGAVAEASADMDGRFELTTSAAGPRNAECLGLHLFVKPKV